jgi:hypothetical protein
MFQPKVNVKVNAGNRPLAVQPTALVVQTPNIKFPQNPLHIFRDETYGQTDRKTGRDKLLMIRALYALSATKAKTSTLWQEAALSEKRLIVCTLCAYFCYMRAANDLLVSLAFCALEYA